MELVGEIYWAIPIEEAKANMDDDTQRKRFSKFIQRHYLPTLEDGELGIFKTDLDKFYWQFGYHFWDRLNEN